MRNLRFKTKKIIVMFLVALTIYTSIFSSSVLQVEAVGIPYSGEFVSAMLQVYGYNMGFGTTADGMNNTSSEMFAEMQARWNKGEIYEVDGTEIPDLRVTANYVNFVSENYDYICAYNNGEVDNAYLDQLNEKSYKASGTLGTKSFQNYLAYASSYIESSSNDEISSDLSDFFNVVTDDGAEISDFSVTNTIFASILCGITAKSQLDATNAWTQPITSNVYTDDYKGFTGSINGVNLKFYKSYYARFQVGNRTYIFDSDEPVLFFLYKPNSSYYLSVFAKSACTITYTIVETNGSTSNPSAFTIGNYCSSNSGNMIYNGGMLFSGTLSNVSFPYNDVKVDDTALANYMKINFENIFYSSAYDLVGNYDSMDASVTDALKSYSGRAVTKSKLLELSNMLEERAGAAAGTETAVSEIASTITEAAVALPEAGTGTGTGTGEYASILEQMLAILGTLSSDITGYFALPLSGIQEGIDAIPAALADVLSGVDVLPGELASLGDRILTIPKSLWEYLEKPLADILDSTKAIADVQKQPWEDDDTDRSSDSVSLLNGFYFLIIIIIKLLEIFWHCLQFIVAIFEIQASTAFLPEEVIMGLDYLKTLEITGIGLSVYDFLMGLVYILIVFSVVRVLRKNIDRIHVPGHGIKKAS